LIAAVVVYFKVSIRKICKTYHVIMHHVVQVMFSHSSKACTCNSLPLYFIK
jgi:hypothetical protein